MLPSLLYHCLALFHGRKVDYTVRPAPLILSKVAKTEPKNVPMHFDWRNVNGKSFVVADVNQHIPTCTPSPAKHPQNPFLFPPAKKHQPLSFGACHADCGSCWIHGTIAALNDRIKVARGAAYPDVMLSRQAALNCIRSRSAPDEPPQGCNGGDPWDIHEHLSHSPLPDETCQPYEAKNGVCDTSGVCRNCLPQALVADPAIPPTKWSTPGCFSVEPAATYGVSEYGGVAGEHAMQQEILARGPIVCGVAADMTFLLEYEQHLIEGVYVDESYFPMGGAPSAHNASEVDHDVEVTGWGVTPGGIPYWVVRNSWGTCARLPAVPRTRTHLAHHGIGVRSPVRGWCATLGARAQTGASTAGSSCCAAATISSSRRIARGPCPT